jgi:hypothetical protein
VKALKALFFGLLAAATLAGTDAHANTAYAPGQGAVSSLNVGIDVKASVKDRCGFATGGAPSGTLTQADFDTNGFTKDFALVLNCTGASRVAVTSANGGLATTAPGANGYATKAPYDVALKLVADNAATATATCAASTLASGGSCTAFAGTAAASTGLRLGAAATKANGSYLRVSAPAYASTSAPLVAGSYSDTLTITVSAAP